MKLDKFHNRLDNPADMDSEKLNRHIEAHLLGGDEHVDTYDVSVNTTSKTATARRFRPAYLSWIAVVVVVALAIALPMTLTNRGNGDGIVPPSTLPEGPSDFYCDSSQYVIKKISQSINEYASVIGWNILKLDFDNILYQPDSQRAYASNKDEETVYCIGQEGYVLHYDYTFELKAYVAPNNVKMDILHNFYELCTVDADNKEINYYFDYENKIEYVYLNKNDYTYYFQMMGSEEGTLLGYIQQILLI